MPIRPEFRHFYGKHWREVVRPRILARAGNNCEQCGVPNGIETTRVGGWWLEWLPPPVSIRRGLFRWRDERGEPHKTSGDAPDLPGRNVRVVLTVAHLDHTPGHDLDSNLKALCQWCHLSYDKLHHHETRAARKDAARPLFTSNPTKEVTT
jgi:hypothetical protein